MLTDIILELEMCIIYCLIKSDQPVELFAELTEQEFYHYSNLFTVLKEQYDKYGFIGNETGHILQGHLKEDFEKCLEKTTNVNNAKWFIMVLKQTRAMYQAISLASGVLAKDATYDDMARISQELVKTLNLSNNSVSLDMKQGVTNFYNEKNNPREYITTGYKRLDKNTYIEPGDFVIIGARPSVGKTALAINLAVNMAKKGYRTVFFTLETAATKVFDRLITSECFLDYDRVKRSELTDDEWVAVTRCSDSLVKIPLDIVEASGKTVSWIRAEAVRRNAQVIFVDYLGIVKSDANNRYEKMTEISLDFHSMAQSDKITVFALSQLNRDNTNTTPSLANLRESGQLEQDADVVILLHKDLDEDDSNEIHFEVAKNKEGKRGVIPMSFIGVHQKFVEQTTNVLE